MLTIATEQGTDNLSPIGYVNRRATCGGSIRTACLIIVDDRPSDLSLRLLASGNSIIFNYVYICFRFTSFLQYNLFV